MDTTLLIAVGATILFGIAAFIGVKVGSKNIPSATIQQGYKNLFVTLLPIAAIFGIVWLIISWGFKQSAKNSLLITSATIWSVIYFLAIISWFRSRKKAGKVLLDLMPYPHKTLVMIVGVFFIVLGFSGTYSLFWRDSEYSWLISSIIGLSIGTYQIFVSFTHIRMHESGVLAYVDLVKWEKIESFQWISGDKQAYTLKLKYKGRLPGFMRNGALPVPVEKKAEVDLILEKYLASIISAQNRA